MAKSGKSAASSQARPAAVSSTSPKVLRDYLTRPTSGMEGNSGYSKVFWGVAAFALVAMLYWSLGSGINADDKFQNDYSEKLVNYYTTFGKDSSALYIKDGNMHLYGGFFEITTGMINRTLGFTPNDWSYHHVRHLSTAVMGWLAILFAALLGRYIAGWRAGLLTLVLLFLSPRFLGESLMNPKDIPFAFGYTMTLYFMAKVLDRLPRPGRWDLVGLAGGLAIALAMRAGGLLPYAYLLMFAGLHFLLKNGGLVALGNGKLMARYVLVGLGVALTGYLVAVLLWPYALQNPLKNPLEALSKFEDFEIRIRVLFEGINVRSDMTPWYYAPKWILISIPLAVVVGFIGSLLLSVRMMRRYHPLWVFMVFFAGIFPVAYIASKDSVLYDGWRHLTFVYPAIGLAAGLFWNEVLSFFESKKPVQYAFYGLFALLMADAVWFIGSNAAFPYVYFNPIQGGVKGAFGQHETDYWGLSIRQGLEWMESQGIIGENMENTVVIATSMAYPAQKLAAKYGDKVKIKYLKWDARCNDAWDYALYPTRTIGGVTLRKGFWPPDNAIHTIDAGGAPILAILKDNGRNCSLGMALLKTNDFSGAIEKFQAEIANVPDNELAWGNLGQAYFSAGQALAAVDPIASDSMLELSKASCEKALSISPDDSPSMNLLGMYWLQKNDIGKAKSQFEYSVKMEPSNPGGFYYLALIAAEQRDAGAALAYLQKSINANPSFKPAYELAIRIHEQSGNTDQANRIRAMIQQIK